jgi:hypothetical protein
MSDWFAILWLPYLTVIGVLFVKRNVWAPIILVWVGVLNYRLPIIPGYDTSLFLVGVLLCLGIFLADMTISRVVFQVSPAGRPIFWATFFYAILVFVSVMVFGSDTYVPKRLQSSFDFSLLFFVTLPCLKSMVDVRTLIKGLVLSVILMTFIGVVGYLLDNPWWGHTIYDDETALMLRDLSGMTYNEKLRVHLEMSRGKHVLTQRMRLTASDPNSLSTTIMLAIPFLMYFWFYRAKFIRRIHLAISLAVMMICVYLAASRTGMLGVLICLAVIAWGLARLRRISWFQLAASFGLVSLLVVITFFVGDVGSTAYQRASKIEGTQDVIDAQGRMGRWKYHLRNIEPKMILIGDGSSGAQAASGSTLAHMDYLTIIYRAGFLALLCYLLILFKGFKNARRAGDQLLAWCIQATLIAYAVVGITQQTSMAKGPGYLFWPIVAVLASRFLLQPEEEKEASEPEAVKV